MKTRNVLLGLGVAAGAFLAVTALNKKSGNSVKQYVSKQLKKVSKNGSPKEKEQQYI